MDPRFKVVNTTCKGNVVAIELRARNGQVTPAMRAKMRINRSMRVVPGNNPNKVFILTHGLAYARVGEARDKLVESLGALVTAA